MTNLLQRLLNLPKTIKVGVIGIGSIGKGIAYQISSTPGMDCVAMADIQLERAVNWAQKLQLNYRIVQTPTEMSDAVRSKNVAICNNGMLISQCEEIEVVVDSSYAILQGAKFALTAIESHKHMVMMNSEADLAFGPYLLKKAQEAGVVYTSADGDQHTVLKRVQNEIELWGFKPVMAGNMKGFLDRYSNPTKIIPEADLRFMDYKMCTSYTDGTKVAIEMALIANAIDGKVTVPGMSGPRVGDINTVFNHFDFEKIWDGQHPVVDYVLGAYPPGGVFMIGYNDHPHQMETLGWYPCRLGPGPFYLFHRPYHLGHIEVVSCIAEAYLDQWALLNPIYGFKTNVFSYAKRDLENGRILDGIGGYDLYGLIENVTGEQAKIGLPICISEGLELRREIRKDNPITMEDVIIDPMDEKFELYTSALAAQSTLKYQP